jgi:hypothetical protein
MGLVIELLYPEHAKKPHSTVRPHCCDASSGKIHDHLQPKWEEFVCGVDGVGQIHGFVNGASGDDGTRHYLDMRACALWRIIDECHIHLYLSFHTTRAGPRWPPPAQPATPSHAALSHIQY